jgi:hypothetical protein
VANIMIHPREQRLEILQLPRTLQKLKLLPTLRLFQLRAPSRQSLHRLLKDFFFFFFFFFTLDYMYFCFLSSVATCAAGTKGTPLVTAINKNQLTWKLSVPANDRKKPLSDKDGFRVLLRKVAEVIGRKKDCSMVIMLSPLSKIATNMSSMIFRPLFIICWICFQARKWAD